MTSNDRLNILRPKELRSRSKSPTKHWSRGVGLALALTYVGCEAPRPAEVGDSIPSNQEKQGADSDKAQQSAAPGKNPSKINTACEIFCDKLIFCESNGKHTRESCIKECVDEAQAVAETDQCLDAFAENWRCQSEEDCDDMGLGACQAELEEIEKACFSDDPNTKKVVELPTRKLRLACESMCKRIDACKNASHSFTSECYEDCTPYPFDSDLADPNRCLLTTAAWANCRAALPCKSLLEGTGCEEEKDLIQCGP